MYLPLRIGNRRPDARFRRGRRGRPVAKVRGYPETPLSFARGAEGEDVSLSWLGPVDQAFGLGKEGFGAQPVHQLSP